MDALFACGDIIRSQSKKQDVALTAYIKLVRMSKAEFNEENIQSF